MGRDVIEFSLQNAMNKAETPEMVRFKLKMDALKQRLNEQGGGNEEAKLKETCTDFEALFLSKIWKDMRNSIPKDGPLHSKMEESYMSMFDTEFGKHLAGAGGMGLGDMLYDHLKTRLEAATASATPGAEQDIKPLNPRMGRPESIEAAENPITHDIALRTTPHVNPGLLSELEVQRRVDQLAERIIAEGADGQPRNMADQPVPGRTVAAEDAMRGVHIEAPSGTPVQAVRDGLVTFVGEQDGQRTVVVEHMDGRESVYSRVGNASVREGAPVQAGQQIATIGSNDPKSPPGLHFTIRSGPAPEPGRT